MRFRHLLALAAAALVGCSDDSPSSGDTPSLVLTIQGGDNQGGNAGTALATPFSVKLVDGAGAVVVGRTIAWSVTAGGGTLDVATSTTNAQGIATAALTLGTVGLNTVKANVSDAPTVAVTFTATAAGVATLVATVPVPANYGHHDTFVRDGIAFVMAWNTGVQIYDVGNGTRGGSPSSPQLISTIVTNVNGVSGGAQDHNAWWFHNPTNGQKKYLFVGQEGPGAVGATSSGDIHIVDVSNLAAPVEVGFIHVSQAGAHNFWMDEQRQVLYAAYYNGGVIAVDVSGTLQGDMSSRITSQVRPGGIGGTYIWGVQLSGNTLYATDMLNGFWALDPVTLAVKSGGNNVSDRYGSDQWVVGNWAYSGTWGTRAGKPGNAVKVWSLAANGAPTLVDSIIVPGVVTVSDVAVTADGKALVLTTEGGTGGAGLYVYDRATNPQKPVLKSAVPVAQGLHTGEVAVINGRTYVFAARDPANPALMIFDITGVVP